MTSAIQAQRDYETQYGGPEIYPVASLGVLYNPNLKQHLYHKVTLSANTVIGQPLNPPPPGNIVVLQAAQDGTGSWSLTWAGCYRDAPNWSAGGVANSTAIAMFLYDGQSYQFIGGSSAFSVQNQQVAGATGSVSYLGAVPVPVANPAPGKGTLTLAGVAPTLTNNAAIVTRVPTVGAVTIVGGAVTLSESYLVPGAGAVVYTGYQAGRTP